MRPKRQTEERPAEHQSLNQEIAGVVIAAAGAWLFLAVAGSGGGQVGDYLRAGVRALVGGAAAWLVPVALVALGLHMIVLRRGFRVTRRIAGLALLILVFIVAVELIRYPYPPRWAGAPDLAGRVQDWDNALAGFGGGIIGYTLGLGVSLFGLTGRWVVLAAAAVIGFILATEVSLAEVLRWSFGRAGTAGRAVAAGAARLARRTAAPASRPPALRPDAVAAITSARKGDQVPAPAAGTAGGPAAPAVRPAHPPGVRGAEVRDTGAGGAEDRGAGARRPEAGTDEVPFRIHVAGQPDPAPAAGTPGRPAADAAGSATAGAGNGQAGGEPPSRLRLLRQGGAGQKGEQGEQGQQGQTGPAAGAPADSEYHLPPLDLLQRGRQAPARDLHREIVARARHLEEVLKTYGVPAKVVEVHQGPTITRYELTVEAGTKISKVTSLADDLAYHLAAPDVRIEAPIPGKRAIGIEVPNPEVVPVLLRDVLESPEFQQNPSKLAVGLGKDIAGKPIVGALDRMPHLLIAGATGSGKSVCLNSIICSLLVRAKPDEVKMLMIDPKRVELAVYDGIPHLMAPVCTDPRKAAGYLKWAVREMENRYDLFATVGVRNITHYNEWVQQNPVHPETGEVRKPLPYVVIIIDELADLMMVAPVDVEDAICRLAQMARACGMHLVVATQRPSVDVITGLIKANIPSRIAFATSSAVDSRTILDMGGAEKLLGKGDMLYHPAGASKPLRAQGAFVSDKEVEALVGFVRRQGQPQYVAEALEGELTGRTRGGAAEAERDTRESALDSIFPQAVRVVIEHGQASVSILQRRLRCNYTKAARLIDMMEERGFIGPHQGPKPREVLITMPQWEQLFGGRGESAAVKEP